MINVCEDELICDLAQTYGVFDYKELSPSLVATLTLGLPDNSRVKMKFSGQKLSYEHSVLALILDAINNWIWMNQKKGTPRPKSMYKMLTAEKPEREELQTFDSTDEFDAWLESKRNKDV